MKTKVQTAAEETKEQSKTGEMWIYADVIMNFIGRLCGSVPLKKEMVQPWLNGRKPDKKPEEGRTLEEIEKEVLEHIEEVGEKITLGFENDQGFLSVRGEGTIKAHLKDCANVMRDHLTPPISGLKAKFANAFYIDEYWIPILKDGKKIKETDGEFDKPVHAMTRSGVINSLKTVRFVETPSLRFRFKLLNNDKAVTREIVDKIFDYGSTHGYAGERGQGEGKYRFEIKWLDGES